MQATGAGSERVGKGELTTTRRDLIALPNGGKELRCDSNDPLGLYTYVSSVPWKPVDFIK